MTSYDTHEVHAIRLEGDGAPVDLLDCPWRMSRCMLDEELSLVSHPFYLVSGLSSLRSGSYIGT